jgi:hypothetical protein
MFLNEHDFPAFLLERIDCDKDAVRTSKGFSTLNWAKESVLYLTPHPNPCPHTLDPH